MKMLYDIIHALIRRRSIVAAYALDGKGIAAAISKMAFGNKFGITLEPSAVTPQELFAPAFGSFVAEVPADQTEQIRTALQEAGLDRAFAVIGEVCSDHIFRYGDTTITMEEALNAWTGTLEKVFPTIASDEKKKYTQNFIIQTRFMYAGTRPQSQPYLFRSFREQTVKTIPPKHLNAQAQR